MCIKFEELDLEHIVEFTKDSTIFVAAREGNGHIRLFLIHSSTGNVYCRNGTVDSWTEIYGRDRDSVVARFIAARNGRSVPRYTINGSTEFTQSAAEGLTTSSTHDNN